jgi:hypothetical protein
VIVRRDLPLGLLAAMIVHAAGESSPGGLSDDTCAVVLAARDEAQLGEVASRLKAAGVPFTSVFEPDPPHNGALMALGLVPARKETIRRHLSQLPLLK